MSTGSYFSALTSSDIVHWIIKFLNIVETILSLDIKEPDVDGAVQVNLLGGVR